MWAKLPKSRAYLQTVKTEKVRSSEMVRGRLLWVSLGMWAASFCGLLLVYGLHTWPPTIMGEAGYSLDALLTASLAHPWGFYAFAGAAVVALLALLTVPAHPDQATGV